MPTLLTHVWRDLFTPSGLFCIQRLHVLVILSALFLYLLLPVDLLPEAALGVLGLLDDILLLVGAVVYITILYRIYVASNGEIR